MSSKQTKYIVQYYKDHYARIAINVKPEVKKELQRRAQEAGKSLSSYMVDCSLREGEADEKDNH